MKRAGLSLILAALILSGCASTRTGSGLSVNQLQQIGEKFLAAGDTAGALKYLTEAEAKQPGSAVIQYDLGLAYNQRSMHSEAVSHLQKALNSQPTYPEALNALGAVYAEGGQVELAQECFQKAVADPFYKTPQLAAYNLGSLYEKRGDPDRAIKEYERAIQFQPTYGLAWYRKAQILENMRRGDEARDAYGKAVSGAPDLAEAHLRYGVMSYQAGDMEAALFSLNRVTKLAPNSSLASEAKLYLGRLHEVTRTAPQGSSSREVSPADIDVISRQEIQHQQVKAAVAQPAAQPAPVSPDAFTVAPSRTPAAADPGQFVAAPSGAPPPAPVPASAPLQAAQFNYIVQLGSFVDQGKAEEMKKTLREKGYSPVVKPLKHNVLGKIYVIQLKPEPSFSRATTIVTQLGGEVPGEPVILKVPVEVKSGATQVP